MNRTDILGIVRSSLAFAEGLENDEWDESDYPETHEVDLDSYGVVDFILRLEGEFKIYISDDDAEMLWRMTVGEIVDWLMEVRQ